MVPFISIPAPGPVPDSEDRLDQCLMDGWMLKGTLPEVRVQVAERTRRGRLARDASGANM